jgi:hypothetical protein
LALSSPQAVEAKADEIHRFVMAEVIYKKSDSSDVRSVYPSLRAALMNRMTAPTSGPRRRILPSLTELRWLA